MQNIFKYMIAVALILTVAIGVYAKSNFSVAQDGASFSKEDIEKIVREYLLENPDVVVESIQNYQLKERERQEQAFRDQIKDSKEDIYNDPGSPVAGNPDGDVTIVEFFDYNCGYCKKAMEDLTKLMEADKNVKVVFKEFPILSESSNEIARWALASNFQGKYFDFHLAVMSHSGPKNTAALEKIAKKVGLDVKQLKKDAESKAVRGQIEKTRSLARSLGISGTPAFIINDKLSPGYIRFDVMKQAVENAREENQG